MAASTDLTIPGNVEGFALGMNDCVPSYRLKSGEAAVMANVIPGIQSGTRAHADFVINPDMSLADFVVDPAHCFYKIGTGKVLFYIRRTSAQFQVCARMILPTTSELGVVFYFGYVSITPDTRFCMQQIEDRVYFTCNDTRIPPQIIYIERDSSQWGSLSLSDIIWEPATLGTPSAIGLRMISTAYDGGRPGQRMRGLLAASNGFGMCYYNSTVNAQNPILNWVSVNGVGKGELSGITSGFLSNRYNARMVYWNGKFRVYGGKTSGYVDSPHGWESSDGINWTQVTNVFGTTAIAECYHFVNGADLWTTVRTASTLKTYKNSGAGFVLQFTHDMTGITSAMPIILAGNPYMVVEDLTHNFSVVAMATTLFPNGIPFGSNFNGGLWACADSILFYGRTIFANGPQVFSSVSGNEFELSIDLGAEFGEKNIMASHYNGGQGGVYNPNNPQFVVVNDVVYLIYSSGAIYKSHNGLSWTIANRLTDENMFVNYRFQFVKNKCAVVPETAEEIPLYDWNRVNGGVYYYDWGFNNSDTYSFDTGKVYQTASLSGSTLTIAGETGAGKGWGYVRFMGLPVWYKITGSSGNGVYTVSNPNGDSFPSGTLIATLGAVGSSMYSESFYVADSIGVPSESQVIVNSAPLPANCGNMFAVSEIPLVKFGNTTGATHMRIWRTFGDSNHTVAEGLSQRFVCDIPIEGRDTTLWLLDVSDDSLEGELNLLPTSGNDALPNGCFMLQNAGMIWVGGVAGKSGYWYHSVLPTSDSGYDSLNYEPFLRRFSTSVDYVRCSQFDGEDDTGIALLNGDVFFFKEKKILCLMNGDPSSTPVIISNTMGCAAPNTITCVSHASIGNVIFFLSNLGPAVLSAGGKIQLLSDFSISDLWPSSWNGIFKTSDGLPTDQYYKNQITAAWHNDSWCVVMPTKVLGTTSVCYTPRITFGSGTDKVGAILVLRFPPQLQGMAAWIAEFGFSGKHLSFAFYDEGLIVASGTKTDTGTSASAYYRPVFASWDNGKLGDILPDTMDVVSSWKFRLLCRQFAPADTAALFYNLLELAFQSVNSGSPNSDTSFEISSDRNDIVKGVWGASSQPSDQIGYSSVPYLGTGYVVFNCPAGAVCGGRSFDVTISGGGYFKDLLGVTLKLKREDIGGEFNFALVQEDRRDLVENSTAVPPVVID